MNSTALIVSLDPGLTTGVCYFKVQGGEILQWETQNVPWMTLNPFLSNVQRTNPETVIIEKLPSTLSPEMQRVRDTCYHYFPNAEYILPGLWKPVTNKYPMPKGSRTQHERDAYRMGIYWLKWRYAHG